MNIDDCEGCVCFDCPNKAEWCNRDHYTGDCKTVEDCPEKAQIRLF